MILWVGARSRAAKAKAAHAVDSEGPSANDSHNQSSAKSAFESLFSEFDKDVDTQDDVEFSEPFQHPLYEAAEQPQTAPADVPSVTPAFEQPMAETPESQSFDLRQAVIYQTILHNKYLSDTQSLES